MAKKKRRKKSVSPKQSKKKPLFGFKTVAAFSLIVAIVIAMFVLYPRLSITPASTLDPEESFTPSFELSNKGFFSMSDINLTCYVLSITSTEGIGLTEVDIEPDRIHIEQLQSGEQTITSNLFPINTGGITEAEIEIVVSYKPFLLPFRQEKVFRYATEEDKWGNLHWMPRSNSG